MVRPLVNGVAVALSNTPQITVSAQSSSSSSSSSSPSSSSQELSGYFFIQHKISGKRIRPYNDLEASAIVTAPESWSGNWVQWKMVNSDNGFFYLQNKVTGMYFRPNSGAEGSELVARPQDWSGNWTQWQLEQGTDGYMHIKNRATAMYFAPTGSGDLSTSDYGIATTSWANEATQWQMVPVSALSKKGFAQNDLHKNNEVNVLFGASGVSMQWQQPYGYATVQVMGLDGAVLFAQNITHPYQMSISQSVLGQSNLFIIRLSGTAGEWHSGLINSK
jgi:hypothetical protein